MKAQWFLRGLAGALGIVAGVALYHATADLLSRDALRKYREAAKRLDPDQVAMHMDHVTLRQYVGKRVAALATVEQVEVTRDRQAASLKGLRNGVYTSENGKKVFFLASAGRWNQQARLFEVSQAVRLYNNDFDLETSLLTYEEPTGLVKAPGKVKGKFFGGSVDAMNLAYHLPTGSYQLGPVTWVGQLQGELKQTKNKNRWTIKAQSVSNPTGKREVWSIAEATDGDIIVKAMKIERDVKTDVIVATGNVQYFSREANLLAEKATVYRKEKRAIIEGAVSMLVKAKQDEKLEVAEMAPLRPIVPDSIAQDRPPAPDPESKKLDEEVRSSENRRKYPTQVYCQKIEYWYAKGQRRAKIMGSPQARQELPAGRWRQAWAHEAFYDAEKETLKLMSKSGSKDARFKTSIGDDLRADWFLVSTKEGDEAWQGAAVEGDVISEDEELNDRGDGG